MDRPKLFLGGDFRREDRWDLRLLYCRISEGHCPVTDDHSAHELRLLLALTFSIGTQTHRTITEAQKPPSQATLERVN